MRETLGKLLIALLFLSLLCSCAGPASPTTEETPSASSAPPETQPPASGDPSPPTPPQPPESAPAETSSPDPERDYALKLLGGMTPDEKIGQMFFVRCPQENAPEIARQYALGGFILFAVDFRDRTPEEAAAFTAGCQAASKLPMLMGVDEEGGTVTRISRYAQYRGAPFLSPQALCAQGGFALITSDTAEKSALLKKLGINMNLAPVCDVSTGGADFINARSFGRPAEETAQYVETVVREMKADGVGSCLKHFPGYGSNPDTHTGTVTDSRDCAVFETSDFLPFAAGIKSGADAVLVSHSIVTCMDPSLPASLSPAVHKVLRETLGFDGAVMTDDLGMDAVKLFTDTENAAVLAVLAGNDLIVTSDYAVQIPAVKKAVESGEISEKVIDSAVLRILKLKLDLGIIEMPK